MPGDPRDRDLSFAEHEVSLGAFEMFRRHFQNFLSNNRRCGINRISGDYRSTARKRTGTPRKAICITGHNVNIADIDPNLIRNDLSKRREVTLSLRTDTRSYANLAICLNLNPCAFVRPDACTLHIANRTDA